MKNIHPQKQLGLAIACALAFGLLSTGAHAQAPALAPVGERPLVTTTANQVWMSGFGLCWHSAIGIPPVSTAECDPNYRVAVQSVEPVRPAVVVADPPAPRAAPAPAPVAARPAVIALVTPAPAVMPVVVKVTLDVDTLFDFDKSTLRPEGRSTLDDFVAKLVGLDLESIMAIGHADRLGSDQYNQALSEKRAEAVKTYLIGKGVQSNRVYTEGKGETQPVMASSACVGGQTAKVIACLQADRRVDVEVIATRTTR